MFGDGISYVKRANFLYNNVCDLPDNLKSKCHAEIMKGLIDLRHLLLTIYKDVATYSTDDPLESYHNMTYTANLFLYAISVAGEIKENGVENYLSVSKNLFKKAYKKSNLFPLAALENYGIYFEYYKGDKIVEGYKRCNLFNVHFENSNNIALALAFLSSTFDTVNNKSEYGDAITLFGKADYERLVLKSSADRECISPKRTDIINTLPNMKKIYIKFVEGLLDMGLTTSCYYQRYCCPFWNVIFLQGKKNICKIQIFDDYVHISIAISKISVERLIVGRKIYPETIITAIEEFGCVSCGKCKKSDQQLMKVIDGVKCCIGHSEATKIFMPLQKEEEVNAILEIIKEFSIRAK